MLIVAAVIGSRAPHGIEGAHDFGVVPEAVVQTGPLPEASPAGQAPRPVPTTPRARTFTTTVPPPAPEGAAPARAPRPAGARRTVTREPLRARGPVTVPPGKLAPVGVSLPGRKVAPVVPQGVTDGHLDIPEAVQTLGWWADGAGLDATAGSIVVAGHVDSKSQGLGYLASLREVAPGQRIVVRGSDGKDRNYYVAGRRTYGKSAGLPQSVFSQSVQKRLVLITCSGRFDRATGRYEDNLVVYATPAP